MNKIKDHIPWLNTISDFYDVFRIGKANNDAFTMIRMEDQPSGKLLFMPLFRGNFFRLVICRTAGLRFLLPDQVVETSVNSIYFAYPGKIESWQRIEEIEGYHCCFTAEFADLDMMHDSFAREFPFLTESANTILNLSEQEMKIISTTAESLLTEMSSQNADKFLMIKHLLKVLLIQIRRMYEIRLFERTEHRSHQFAVMAKYRKAVNEYFIRLSEDEVKVRPTVSIIAAQLNINASYLNSIIKQYSGRTASHFINEKMVLEAKSYLMHTDLQISEIAYTLLFADVPYFVRFFKRMTGQTPGSFRLTAKMSL